MFYRTDARDKDAMREIVKHNITEAIHLAGLKSVAESVSNPLEYYKVNLGTTLTLLEVLSRQAGQSYSSSSATVYGVPDHIPVDEDAFAGTCFNPYGRTKYFNEQTRADAVAASEGRLGCAAYFTPSAPIRAG